MYGLKHGAYWIDPSGKTIPVDLRHINTIIKSPRKFGMTKSYIEKIYKKHKEPMNSEGNAREEIMANLLKEGWIRLRYLERMGSWTAQLSKLDNRRKEYLFEFAMKITDGTLAKQSKYTDIKIMDDKSVLASGSLESILNFKIFECNQTDYLELISLNEYEGVGITYKFVE